LKKGVEWGHGFAVVANKSEIIFSRCGFTAEAEEYCKEKGIACSEDVKMRDG
jgi:hypothetical protein